MIFRQIQGIANVSIFILMEINLQLVNDEEDDEENEEEEEEEEEDEDDEEEEEVSRKKGKKKKRSRVCNFTSCFLR